MGGAGLPRAGRYMRPNGYPGSARFPQNFSATTSGMHWEFGIRRYGGGKELKAVDGRVEHLTGLDLENT